MTTDELLGDGYETRTLPLAPGADGELVATLVRRLPDGPQDAPAPTRAVLYVHGFVDYFFQRELADFYAARGWAFYALDLRRAGRSLRAHQTPYYVESVGEWFEELDAAVDAIRADGAGQLLVNGHSAGGLATSLWAHARRDDPLRRPDALVLNSPFLDLNVAPLVRDIGGTVAALLARRAPRAVIPGGISDLYPKSIHREHRGEWTFDTRLKPIEGVPIRAGWLHAIRRAQQRVQRGLEVRCPVLVMCAARSSASRRWHDDLLRTDAILDVEQIARHATRLGPHVTCIRIEDGMHDLVLSAAPVRARVYGELERWLGAYAP